MKQWHLQHKNLQTQNSLQQQLHKAPPPPPRGKRKAYLDCYSESPLQGRTAQQQQEVQCYQPKENLILRWNCTCPFLQSVLMLTHWLGGRHIRKKCQCLWKWLESTRVSQIQVCFGKGVQYKWRYHASPQDWALKMWTCSHFCTIIWTEGTANNCVICEKSPLYRQRSCSLWPLVLFTREILS